MQDVAEPNGRDESGLTVFTPLLSAAESIGHDVWIERQVFELLGTSSATRGAPAVTVHLAGYSRRHGWHAQNLFDRLPELSVLDPEQLVVAPGPRCVELFGAMRDLVGDPTAALAAHNRVVLPSLVARYRHRARSASSVADATTPRWLRILVDDDLEEWADGEDVLRSTLRSSSDLAHVLDAVASIEHVATELERLDG